MSSVQFPSVCTYLKRIEKQRLNTEKGNATKPSLNMLPKNQQQNIRVVKRKHINLNSKLFLNEISFILPLYMFFSVVITTRYQQTLLLIQQHI